MRDPSEPKLVKWPFLLGDGLLLGMACLIYARSSLPLGRWELGLLVLCVVTAALCIITPFLLEYRVALRLAEANGLATVVDRIRDLEKLADHVTRATGQWQFVQEAADKTAASAQQIVQRITDEARAFTEFMQRANDSEKATLRLEVEKLRRAEGDWVQVLVRVLDHVYALHLGALRSGHASLIEQTSNFQSACREAARRVGLAPFIAQPSAAFDAQRHQLVGDAKPPAEALVGETVAAGYTFQGRLLRPALVRLKDNGHAQAPAISSGS
jgi:molecular chaperone GrpE (heat shock protein)